MNEEAKREIEAVLSDYEDGLISGRELVDMVSDVLAQSGCAGCQANRVWNMIGLCRSDDGSVDKDVALSELVAYLSSSIR